MTVEYLALNLFEALNQRSEADRAAGSVLYPS
jgi:hypothetical protein